MRARSASHAAGRLWAAVDIVAKIDLDGLLRPHLFLVAVDLAMDLFQQVQASMNVADRVDRYLAGSRWVAGEVGSGRFWRGHGQPMQ